MTSKTTPELTTARWQRLCVEARELEAQLKEMDAVAAQAREARIAATAKALEEDRKPPAGPDPGAHDRVRAGLLERLEALQRAAQALAPQAMDEKRQDVRTKLEGMRKDAVKLTEETLGHWNQLNEALGRLFEMADEFKATRGEFNSECREHLGETPDDWMAGMAWPVDTGTMLAKMRGNFRHGSVGGYRQLVPLTLDAVLRDGGKK